MAGTLPDYHRAMSSTLTPPRERLARGVPLDVYMNQISPGSAGKSIGQLRREAVEKSGVIQGAS